MSTYHIAFLLLLLSIVPIWSKGSSNQNFTSNESQAQIDSLPTVNSSSNHSLVCSNDHPCPPALFCEEGKCKCGHYPYDIIKCDEDKGTSAVLDCHCASIIEGKKVTVAGACVYNCENYCANSEDLVYHPLLKNDTICSSFNRTGALCGMCLPEHYPMAYSFNLTCIPCSNIGWNWGRYIMAAYLPLTIFCFFVFFFQINIITSHLYPVIWYSQTISVPALSRILLLSSHTQPSYLGIKIMLSLYGIWNLDFFKPFYSDICLGLGLLPTLALEYAIAMYPFILMAISYLLINLYDKNYRVIVIMWKPFRTIFFLFKKNWNMRTSLIDSYATFFLLSNVKFISVTVDLLIPTKVYELHNNSYNYTWGLYYSGEMKYFGKEHLLYAIIAMIVSVVFIILPITVLALYPFAFFQKCLNCIPVRWHILHTFMDSFTGCYKNGTEPGTRDYRWFIAVFFSLRLFLFLIYAFVHTTAYFILAAISIMLLVILIANVQPFKQPLAHYSKINITFFTLLALFSVTICGLDITSIKVHQLSILFYIIIGIFLVLPLVYAVILVTYWIFSRRQFGLKLANKVRAWRNGYRGLDDDTDNLIDSIERAPEYNTKSLTSYS